MNWGPRTDLGLYGSSYVGLLGAIVRPTTESQILQLDLLATDFFRPAAYPTFLCYNPHPDQRQCHVAVGAAVADIYDAVRHQFVAQAVTDTATVVLPSDSAAVFVVVPAGATLTRDGQRILCDGVVIDWNVSR